MSGHEDTISNADFNRLRGLIYDESGIHLSPEKKTMLELRIKRRLHSLDLASFSDYCAYLFSPAGRKKELVDFLNVVTTNKTDFFREPEHFDYLAQRALPELVLRNRLDRPLLAWSAGCSSGEEPYTLAMVMSEFARSYPGFQFRILATDISTSVLSKAKAGIYREETVKPVAVDLRKKYFMRSRDRNSDLVRVVPELRQTVEFRRLNFKDAQYDLVEKVDLVFCRNVIIYFDRQTQEQILRKIAQQVQPGGYAFLGHSESLHGMDLPLVPVAPALYRRANGRV